MGLILDSTVLVAAERRRHEVETLLRALEDAFGNQNAAISVVSAAELLHGCWRAENEGRRNRRVQFVERVVAEVEVVSIDLEIARVFAKVDADLAAAGTPLPAMDLWIAATALTRGDTLVTANIKDFGRVPELLVHNWE